MIRFELNRIDVANEDASSAEAVCASRMSHHHKRPQPQTQQQTHHHSNTCCEFVLSSSLQLRQDRSRTPYCREGNLQPAGQRRGSLQQQYLKIFSMSNTSNGLYEMATGMMSVGVLRKRSIFSLVARSRVEETVFC